VLNAVLFARDRSRRVRLLDNRLWSQHGTFWESRIEFHEGRFVNRSVRNRRQRAFHCGGTDKFWSYEHSARTLESIPSQVWSYAWYLGMLWFGRGRDWTADPADFLPPESSHLLQDLVQFMPQIMQVLPASRRIWDELTDLLAERLLADLPGRSLARRHELPGLIELVRLLHPRRRCVLLGTAPLDLPCSLAMRFLNHDLDFFVIRSFVEGGSDAEAGAEPRSPRQVVQALNRYSALRLRLVPGDPVHAASLFGDATVDLLYVEGSSTGSRAGRIIEAWQPKVRRGGILAGDLASLGAVRRARPNTRAGTRTLRSEALWWRPL